MTAHVDVSVVICVYNGAGVIGQQLEALSRQTPSCTWEVVVADNGSSDATADVVRSYIDNFPVSLRLVDASARRGAGAARNAGARASVGDKIAFCDCDDEVRPGWVQAAYDALENAELVAGANRLMTTPQAEDAPIQNPGCTHPSTFGPAVQTCNCAVTREMFFKAGGFDESLPPYGMEDSEFSWRVNRAGGRVRPAPDMVINFRRTDDKKTLVRKVYQSGMAELLVWHHYPEVFEPRTKPFALVRDLALFVPQYASLAAKKQLPPTQKILRDGVTRFAHLSAHVQWVMRDGVQPPQLLTPADDRRQAS